MKAVLLHVIGDFLGSIGVITSGLLETYIDWEYRFYIDPITSVVIAIIILSSAIPVLISCAKILLENVPREISPSFVERRLRSVAGVQGVHELHIWQLHETKVIASVHLVADPKTDFPALLDEAKAQLHRMGLHSSTVQIEAAGSRKKEEKERKRARDLGVRRSLAHLASSPPFY